MNGLDGIFILTILLLAFWGFQVGVLGSAIWLVAAYGAIVIGAQLVGRVVPLFGFPSNFTSIAVTLGYVMVSGLLTTLATRYHVIQCQLRTPLTTILTDIPVTLENLTPRQLTTVQRPTNHIHQPNNLRTFKHPRHAVDILHSVLNRLGLALTKQRNRSPHVADVKRLIVLVQHQHPRTYQK